MKIILASVGRQHESYVQQGIQGFSARIEKYFRTEWLLISSPKNAAVMDEKTLKQQEAKIILQQIEEQDFLVLLDERGTQLSSPELASFIQQKANDSTRRLIFLIAGAYGADKSVMQRANYTWSLSKLVFPHMLVRLMLAEQVYRACTILRNEKYHHS